MKVGRWNMLVMTVWMVKEGILLVQGQTELYSKTLSQRSKTSLQQQKFP